MTSQVHFLSTKKYMLTYHRLIFEMYVDSVQAVAQVFEKQQK